ncbi:YbaK/prolyl-tRNA synthetase associated domain-containing protein [Campylobacter blaseri]|uniref:YbaK/aminoacyl-tRNA synthetase-associated domain-containing protein n=1 Tax=Campylobacter blaseri TaxID=2042961 RepID=A0A2P8R3N4_9BACT|nr:YbaK/EbsC family protein [Campylobacter blaseri]PSM53104.1 hypothetical protein CQ405_00710 [Campylobacter blaseri]PSM54570.1 hypothetical protein CRN67_00710 [Campylobacter blaseri]QKF86957.1 YbaK/prolyl-tRNA synthetase associated domain-containing protein [Campylobacter blaseri]
MSEQIFNKLNTLLSSENAKFRVIEHESAGTSQEVAKVRGTMLGQGAKALVCVIKGVDDPSLDTKNKSNLPKKKKLRVLAVLPADMQANLASLALELGGVKASLASPAEVSELTDCVFGSIPPFSFNEKLLLVADSNLLKRYDEIAFNAGLLDKSIVLNTKDYARIAKPKLINFATR